MSYLAGICVECDAVIVGVLDAVRRNDGRQVCRDCRGGSP